ncbi:MAG: hypothetical protein HC875_14575 [Anaerolineales bacterium]|nr:hypothetical protein [Anaerolineales bacterium]
MQTNRKVMITRRRRRRLLEQKPKIFLYLLNFAIALVAVVVAAILTVILSSVGSAYAVYNSFAQQLPDPTAMKPSRKILKPPKSMTAAAKPCCMKFLTRCAATAVISS